MTEPRTVDVSYLRALAGHKTMCVLVPLALAGAAFLGTLAMPRMYRAEAAAAITTIDFGVNQMNFRGVPSLGLVSFFQSGDQVEKVIREFKLSDPPYGYSRHDFMNAVLSVTAPRETNVIGVAVKLSDPELAAKVADYIAENGIRAYNEEMERQHQEMIQGLGDETQLKRTELTDAERKLQEFQAKAQVETLRTRVTVQQALLGERETRMNKIRIDLAGVNEKLKTLREALAKESPLVDLKTILAKDPVLQQALARQAGKPVEDLTQLGLLESVVNPVYVSTAKLTTQAAAQQSSLQAELVAAQDAAKAGDELLSKLAADLAGAEREQRELVFTRDRAVAAANMSMERWQDKKTLAIWPPHRMTLLRASIPDKPYWPKKATFTLSALLVGFVAMWALAIFLDARKASAGAA